MHRMSRCFAVVALLHQTQQLTLQAHHLALQLCRVEGVELAPESVFGVLGHLGAGQHALIRGLRIVVDPPHPRALAGPGDQLPGGVEEVDQQPQLIVELVEQRDLLLGLQAQVADVPAHHVVVLLLGEVVVVLAVGARAGEADALLVAVAVQVVVDDSLPLSVCREHRANGNQERISSSPWKTRFCGLLSPAWTSTHSVRRR